MRTYSCRPTPITLLENLSARSAGRGSFSSARISTTPGPTRSTTSWARACWCAAWAKAGSSPRPGPASTAWPRRPWPPAWGWNAPSIWGAVDVERQRPNVFWMEQLGAEVVPVTDGSATLKDAINESLRDWAYSMAEHALCARHGLRSASLPANRGLFPANHRRGERQQMLPRWGACPTGCTPASAAAPTPRAYSWGSSTTRPLSWSGWRLGARGLKTGAHAARLAGLVGAPGVGPRLQDLLLSRRRRPNAAHALGALG